MSMINEQFFSRLAGLVQKGGQGLEKTIWGSWVRRLTPVSIQRPFDWEMNAKWALFQQEPLRARYMIYVSGISFTLILLWAGFAQIDEVTRGDARVVPTSQVQIIQSVDGGIIEDIAVKDGDIVKAGQLLLKIDPTRFVSSLQESKSTQLALEAKAARLEALTRGTSFQPSDKLKKQIPEILDQEKRLYESRLAEINAQVAIAQNQLGQRQQELNEVKARREQAERGLELVTRELNATRPMLSSGAVSEVEILRLEREATRLKGDREQASAQISRVQSAISEANKKIDEVRLTSRNQMSAELSEVFSKLSSYSQGGIALEDKVKHANVISPVDGTVKRLLINTKGAVVQPGKELLEIVPLNDALILDALVHPKDIAFLTPKQKATVKFTAYDFSIFGGLEAEVISISPDSVVDEKGNAFYHVRVKTIKSSLGPNLPIIPGMVAQVDILTGKKSILSYLLKPVLRAKANSFTER